MLLLSLALCCTGCSTVIGRATNPRPPGAYTGVRVAGEQIEGRASAFSSIASVVDFPFSFAADTLLLPVDLANAIGKGSGETPAGEHGKKPAKQEAR